MASFRSHRPTGILRGVPVFLLPFVLGAGFCACSRSSPPVVPADHRLPLPSKDELAVWGERRISLNDFELVRLRHPGLSPDSTWALMTAAIALEASARERASVPAAERTASTLANLLRPLFPPRGSEAERAETLRVLNSRFGANAKDVDGALAYLNSLLGRFPLETNRALLSEIGVSAPPQG